MQLGRLRTLSPTPWSRTPAALNTPALSRESQDYTSVGHGPEVDEDEVVHAPLHADDPGVDGAQLEDALVQMTLADGHMDKSVVAKMEEHIANLVEESPAGPLSPTPSSLTLSSAEDDNFSERSSSDDEGIVSEDDDDEEETPYPHIFVVGDAADAFGALKAGHTAYFQAEVAARNIVRLINGDGDKLERYTPGAPAIKVTLGMVSSPIFYFVSTTFFAGR
jgi:hypothetical protein